MKNHLAAISWFGNTCLLAALLSGCVTGTNPQSPATLKDAYKGHFHIGVAINRSIALNDSVRADNVNRNREQVDKDIALVKEQFDQISPENDLKWAIIHPQAGADGYDFGPADAYVNFGVSNHMYIVGHTLVWHGQTPSWVFQGTHLPSGMTNPPLLPPAVANAPGTNGFGRRRPGRGFGGGFGGFNMNGPHASREELLQRMHDHIFTVVGRYKGIIKVWDVVNEALADGGTNILRTSPWEQIIGPDFIAKAFEYAHEADPHAILRYNDYSLENPAKRKKLITLIKSLQEQHVPVMAIGSQTHVSVTSPSFQEEDQVLTDLETLGLPIHITEFDVNSAQGGQRNTSGDVAANAATTQGGLVSDSDRKLAKAYAGLFQAFIKHQKSVKVVTLWGVNDAVSWRAQGHPLLFDGNDQPKPAFSAVISAATGELPHSPAPPGRPTPSGSGHAGTMHSAAADFSN
jgi:endo-1,4-beta-xylanase